MTHQLNKQFKKLSMSLTCLFILIITIPSFLSLFNGKYFTMHDDQHIARLYLLDQGIRQGYIYPRWVDMLGFGFGYPLFNFYPPAIYYIASAFHLFGVSFLSSIKLVIFSGYLLGSLGIYLFMKKITNSWASILSVVLYTYFFYHAVLIYVRGAFAEFFALSILPFVFLSFYNLYKEMSLKNSIFFGLTFAALILTHPFIALPSLFFIFLFAFFLLSGSPDKKTLIRLQLFGLLTALLLSSFFWLPSLAERKFTLTDNILTKELANYRLHYVYPGQFWYSPWGYGGSIGGSADGMTYQLGKIHLSLVAASIILALIYYFKKSKFDYYLKIYIFFLFLAAFSLIMTTKYSSFIWDNIKYLWYLQFPWRFLTFSNFFIAVVAGYSIFFISEIIEKSSSFIRFRGIFLAILIMAISFTTIVKYQKYFRPQKYLETSDKKKTSFEEVAWKVSRSSFEFIPSGVKTKKSDLGTTIPAISSLDLPSSPFEILNGQAETEILENKFGDKKFKTASDTDILFRLNTYNFPGWTAYIDSKKVAIAHDNKYKLITIWVPAGQHWISFKFENTPVRNIANFASIVTGLGIIFYFLKCNYLISSKR